MLGGRGLPNATGVRRGGDRPAAADLDQQPQPHGIDGVNYSRRESHPYTSLGGCMYAVRVLSPEENPREARRAGCEPSTVHAATAWRAPTTRSCSARPATTSTATTRRWSAATRSCARASPPTPATSPRPNGGP